VIPKSGVGCAGSLWTRQPEHDCPIPGYRPLRAPETHVEEIAIAMKQFLAKKGS
jgi:hypothetical protein